MFSTTLRTRFALPAFVAALIILALPAVASAAPEFSLTIETAGSGSGTWQCEVNEGPDEECAAEYPEGTELIVVAEPDEESEFGTWSGDCGPLECALTMDENHVATVTFEALEPEEFALYIEEPGSGEGTVECEVGGGPEPCEGEYPEGTVVTLIAEALEGSEFVEWGGECDSISGGECELTMDEEKAVEVTFEPEPEEFTLNIEESGTGTGSVLCEAQEGPEPCVGEYLAGTELVLIASADSGSEFVEWSGECDSIFGDECELTMNEEKTVEATFDLEPTPEFALEINTDGTGEGEVDCKVGAGPVEPCEAEYEEGTKVTLVPEAETGSEFVKWNGDCTGAGVCEVTMSANKAVTATFDLEPAPEFELTIAKVGTGSGSVTCNAGACASTYPEGTEVTLAASAVSGSTFAGWSGGGCSGTAGCKITIVADTTVTATFNVNAKEETKTEEPKKEEPKSTPEGSARAAATAKVKSGKASLRLTCSGGPCKGALQLKAKVTQGKKTKNLVIGKASFSIADGASATIKVKLSGPAKQELAKGKALKAKVGGSGIASSTVKLKPKK